MYHGERFNGLTHLAGLGLALLGGAQLLGGAVGGGDPAKVAAACVFAFSLVALYAASTLFHSTRGPMKRIWQRADHCAIYLLIAGTYTPFALVTLRGPWGWSLLGVVWAAAIFGIWRELRPGTVAQPALLLYIAMGWLAVLAAVPVAVQLERGGMTWLLTGAILYTTGTVFYRNRRGWPHAHGAWHLFVLGGSVSHYAAVAGFVL